jgi:hypothetical protein
MMDQSIRERHGMMDVGLRSHGTAAAARLRGVLLFGSAAKCAHTLQVSPWQSPRWQPQSVTGRIKAEYFEIVHLKYQIYQLSYGLRSPRLQQSDQMIRKFSCARFPPSNRKEVIQDLLAFVGEAFVAFLNLSQKGSDL